MYRAKRGPAFSGPFDRSVDELVRLLGQALVVPPSLVKRSEMSDSSLRYTCRIRVDPLPLPNVLGRRNFGVLLTAPAQHIRANVVDSLHAQQQG